MIKVTVTRGQSGLIHSFEMKGHADFAEHGKDLVCAGASAIAFGSVNAIAHITGVEPQIEQGEQGGYLKVTLPQDLDTETDDKLQVILNTMVTQFYTMTASYSEYIELKYKMV